MIEKRIIDEATSIQRIADIAAPLGLQVFFLNTIVMRLNLQHIKMEDRDDFEQFARKSLLELATESEATENLPDLLFFLNYAMATDQSSRA